MKASFFFLSKTKSGIKKVNKWSNYNENDANILFIFMVMNLKNFITNCNCKCCQMSLLVQKLIHLTFPLRGFHNEVQQKK